MNKIIIMALASASLLFPAVADASRLRDWARHDCQTRRMSRQDRRICLMLANSLSERQLRELRRMSD
jgi:hypothetical protein